MNNNWYNIPVILGREHGFTFCDHNSTVEEWLETTKLLIISGAKTYPNAAKALEILRSPLYKALKED